MTLYNENVKIAQYDIPVSLRDRLHETDQIFKTLSFFQ